MLADREEIFKAESKWATTKSPNERGILDSHDEAMMEFAEENQVIMFARDAAGDDAVKWMEVNREGRLPFLIGKH